MAFQNNRNISIAILDDNFVVRQSLKLLVHRIIEWVGMESSIYSASNGVEGIGYTLVTTPNIIIIDTTLPKYSGREVVEYLRTNEKFINQQIKVLVIDDGSNSENKDSPFKYLNKQSPEFVSQLEKHILRGFVFRNGPNCSKKGEKISDRFFGHFIRTLVWLATKSDTIDHNAKKAYFIPAKLFYRLEWLVMQLIINAFLAVMYLFLAKPEEINHRQAKQDEFSFQLRTYPLTFVSLVVGWLLVLQLITFLIIIPI